MLTESHSSCRAGWKPATGGAVLSYGKATSRRHGGPGPHQGLRPSGRSPSPIVNESGSYPFTRCGRPSLQHVDVLFSAHVFQDLRPNGDTHLAEVRHPEQVYVGPGLGGPTGHPADAARRSCGVSRRHQAAAVGSQPRTIRTSCSASKSAPSPRLEHLWSHGIIPYHQRSDS